MKNHSTPSMGMNRTGIQMSPFDTKDMEKALAIDTEEMASGNTAELAQMRSLYINEADELGSVPAPGTMKGMLKTGVSKLTGNEPTLLLDKLAERLAFERTGTRLYDALITKFEALQDGTTSMTLADLQQIREDEARHFSLIASAIESMGGDPTCQTPCADLVGVESMGLMQAVTDPRTTLAQSLHAILVAEMTDNNGWEMLIALAEENGQDAMVPDFSLALDEERMHLQKIQTWFEEATVGKVISDGAVIDDITDSNPSKLH
jgi:ferritin-like protein